RFLAGLHQRLDRAHCDADPPPERRQHPRDRVLGVHEGLLLRRRGTIRSRPAPRRHRPRPPPRPLVRANRGGIMSAHSVAVEDLRKSWGEREVVCGAALEAEPGSLPAILGASGSGKTTLLRLIAGFDRANAGTIKLGGQMVEGPRAFVPPERRG